MRHNLDLLRSFAVLSVLAAHTLTAVLHVDSIGPISSHKIGYAGVIAFFVHTSCVLMMSLDRLTAGGGSWLDFYVRRVFRLYPLSVVAVLLTAALAIPAEPWSAFTAPTMREIASNVLLAQNLTFDRSLLGQLWSLPLEMQMYLALPLLWWVCRNRAAWLPWVLAGGLVAALAQPSISGRLNVLYYAPCFICGVLVYARRVQMVRFHWSLLPVVILVAYAGLAATPLAYENWAVWGFAAVIGFALPHFRDMPRSWLSRAFAQIAKYSYGIYLTHMAALYAGFWALKAPAPLQWTVFLGLTAGLSVAAYHWVEQPMIDLGMRATPRHTPIAVAARAS